MGKHNRHGLSRTISADVKREVRQRCGFGCVICGLGFYDYEHFAPDFKDATEHNPAGITLLCMQCNQKRARRVLSAKTVALANANPRCLQDGFAKENWGFGSEPITVRFAGVEFVETPHLIEVNGTAMMSVLPPEEGSSIYRVSALFANVAGRTTLEIVENEWYAKRHNWDVECAGNRITIRNAHRDVALVLKSEPPGLITIEKLNMYFQGIYFRGDSSVLEISRDQRSWGKVSAMRSVRNRVGISINIGKVAT